MVDFKKAAYDARRAILIPTKGRPKTLRKLLTRQPFLDHPSTFIGIEFDEEDLYDNVLTTHASKCRIVRYRNDDGITGVAREELRQAWLQDGGSEKYATVLPLDDNMFYTKESVDRLVACSRELNFGGVVPTIVSGEHPTAPHFQADRIELGHTTRKGYRVFPHTTVIYWAIPSTLYAQFEYPYDCCFDDIYLALWLMTEKKVTNWFVCRDAPFDKKRFEAGGQGNAAERAAKFGRGITRLATDFPSWMTTSIVQTRIPYARILEAVRGGKTGF